MEFDKIAQTYDENFSNTVLGKMQRQIFWNYLSKNILTKENLNILELNCGTGEDGLWLASKGHKVMATDISENMISVAKDKAKSSAFGKNISFLTLDISNPNTFPVEIKFDIILSNFGGLNCLSRDSLQKAIPELAKLLNPSGRFIAVVMPKLCLWERLYFSFKLKFNEAKRRSNSKAVIANIGGEKINAWYYSPAQIKSFSKTEFKKIKKYPLGFFLPPSYLNNYFEKHSRLLRMLNRLEKMISSFNFLSSLSDHFIIDMEGKS